MHDPWAKKLFLGFARTSEFNGPRKPVGLHPLIQEVHTDLPILEPMLRLPYRIFGSSPPMSNFDPAKMLTVSLHHFYCVMLQILVHVYFLTCIIHHPFRACLNIWFSFLILFKFEQNIENV
jgi:hypothetical protein